jgi:hypothetical protein
MPGRISPRHPPAPALRSAGGDDAAELGFGLGLSQLRKDALSGPESDAELFTDAVIEGEAQKVFFSAQPFDAETADDVPDADEQTAIAGSQHHLCRRIAFIPRGAI